MFHGNINSRFLRQSSIVFYLCLGFQCIVLSQARRDAVVNLPKDAMWFDDVEQAVQAQREGIVVLAIDLSRKRLRELPRDLMLLKDLTYMLVSRNRLQTFPEWLEDLSDLKVVVADHNRFEDFPDILLRMPHLEHISLGENALQGIPIDIDLIKNLKVLSLWGNVLAHFPASLGNLEHLEILDLLHNEMTVDEQDMLKTLLPNVQMNLSEPCNCVFEPEFQNSSSE